MILSLKDRALWRFRSALFARPSREKLTEPLTIAGLFRAGSGVGEVARSAARASVALGLQPTLIDLSAHFQQVELAPYAGAVEAPTRSASRRGVLLLALNAPETERGLLATRHFFRPGWRTIGYWAWETSRAPESWRPVAARLSEIWAPSSFAAQAIANICETPVYVAPPHVDASAPPPAPATDETFSVLAMADARSSLHRKNIHGAVETFQRAFPNTEPAALTLKITSGEFQPDAYRELRQQADKDARINIIDDRLTRWALTKLIDAHDAFLSVHRAEGFGLPMAEAMARGKAVIATGFSGNLAFMDASCAALVPAREVRVDDPTARYEADPRAIWAEPNIEIAAAKLRDLAQDREARVALGARAQKAIAERLTPERFLAPLWTEEARLSRHD